MTIKEVAERYHLTQDTLRYYERVRMIPEVHRTSGGIRDYQEEDLLKKQKEQLEATMDHLSYKISRYEEAMKTGTLSWDDDRKCPITEIPGVTES